MCSIEFAIIGLAVAFNFLVILFKLQRKRYLDGTLDVAIFATIMFLFSGSFGGLVVGTIASAAVSIYLLVSPPKLPEPKSRKRYTSL
jgi:predicted MFS family arabinose efflux permease